MLLATARSGNRAAFDSLAEAYGPELERFLKARTQASEAEDVLQEVWIAAWQSLPTFDGKSQLRTWLFAIAANKLKDHLRQRNRRAPEVELLVVDRDLELKESPYRDAEVCETLKGLLAKLTPKQYEVLSLYYRFGFTLPEIGSVLDRNVNTVKAQFYQAHAKLADAIQGSSEWLATFGQRAEALP